MQDQFEGKNVEEAVAEASHALGVPADQILYSVVSEKRGFLGGVKSVVINASVREARSTTSTDAPALTEQHESAHSAIPDTASEEALKIRSWLETLLSLTKLSLSINIRTTEDAFHVELSGVDVTKLKARQGELIDAIQVLANKALVGVVSDKKIEFDSEAFKSSREADLTSKAMQLADRVRREGGEQLLAPMTPIERRIVHLALQSDPEVTTESRGEGFYKRVALVRRAVQPGA